MAKWREEERLFVRLGGLGVVAKMVWYGMVGYGVGEEREGNRGMRCEVG